jgi:hypothetical protein
MSWDQLHAIIQEARRGVAESQAEPPTACPNDGEPLRTGPNGELYCRFDGWRWDSTPQAR